MDVSYAKSTDGVHIACTTQGHGPPDLVMVWAAVTHVRLEQEEPLLRRFYDQLAGRCRLVHYDERGFGTSDPIAASDIPTLEQRADDIRVVMDTLGIERASMFGFGDGGPLALFFAATYPDRVDRLVLFCSYARVAYDEDYPIGTDSAAFDGLVRLMSSGRPGRHRLFAPSGDDAFHDRWDRLSENSGGSPAREEHTLRRAWASDVRPVLSSVSAPTLVLHRAESRAVPIVLGRYLAEHLPDAAFVELPGPDNLSVRRRQRVCRYRDRRVRHRGAVGPGSRSGASDGVVHRHR